MRTPVSERGLRKYDHLPAEEAIRRAWRDMGENPYWHTVARQQVREAMPLLARALDRLQER